MIRSHSIFPLILAVAGATFAPVAAWGQTGHRGLISRTDAQRFGLERAWFTQLAGGSFQGEVIDLHLHVSPVSTRFSCEVTWDEGRGRRIFRSTDLDTSGQPYGEERARRRAEIHKEELGRLGVEAELVERADTPVTTLYAVTDRGVIHALDAETGQTVWMTSVGLPRHPTLGVGVNEELVAVLNGTTLYILDRHDGSVRWTRRTAGIPGAAPAMTGTFCFVPMFNGAVEAFNLANPAHFAGIYQSTGRVLHQPLVTPTKISWPTDRGALYVGYAHQYGILYRLETERSIEARPAFANELFYFGTRDAYFYAMRERDGGIAWTLTLGEPILQSPVVMDKQLFVVGANGTLFCRDSLTGVGLWEFPGIRQFLSASSDRVYCIGLDDSLVILNRESRALLGKIDAHSLNFRKTNIYTDRIYLATRTGMLQCFHELEREFPEFHVDIDDLRRRQLPPEEDEEDEDDQQDRRPDRPAPRIEDPFGLPDEDTDEDPFGAPAIDDPFGAPPAIEDPFGAPADMEDPFGAPDDDDEDPFGSPFE
jgi:hypothetical protein